MEGDEKNVFVVGDHGCGKTSIIKSICNEASPLVSLPTTLEKFITKIEIQGKTITLNIWETICSHHYRVRGLHVRKSLYKNADLVIIVFDISRRETLENVLQKWVNEVNLFAPKKTPVILVGNKKDLGKANIDREKSVEYKEGITAANDIDAVMYIECSAVTREGLTDVLVSTGKVLCKRNSSCIIL